METPIGIFNGHEIWQRHYRGKLWRRSARFPDILITEDGRMWDLKRNCSLCYEPLKRKSGRVATGYCFVWSSAIGGLDKVTVALIYCMAWLEKDSEDKKRVGARDGNRLNLSTGNLFWQTGRGGGKKKVTSSNYVALSTRKVQELREQNKARRELGIAELTVSTYTCDICLKTFEYVGKKNMCGCYSSHLTGDYLYCDWGKGSGAAPKVKGDGGDKDVDKKRAWGDNWYARKGKGRGKGRPKGSKNLPKGCRGNEESSMEAP